MSIVGLVLVRVGMDVSMVSGWIETELCDVSVVV